MKNIILSVLAVAGLVVAPFVVSQAFANEPTVVTLQEVTIVGEASAKDFPIVDLSESGSLLVLKKDKSPTITAPKPTAKAKVWTCGVAHESQVGGSYRACEYK